MVARGSDFDIGIHADAGCGFTRTGSLQPVSESLGLPLRGRLPLPAEVLPTLRAGRIEDRPHGVSLEIEVKVDA